MKTSHQTNSKLFTLMQKTWHEQPVNVIVAALSVLLVFWLGWNAINFYSHQRAYTDAGVFQAVAHHIAQDKTLYDDVWDHKPPVIYVLNFLPVYFGDGSINAVRYMERLLITAGLFAFYITALFFSKNPLPALLFTFVFQYIFFTPEMFQGGNLTEEYASFFVLFAMVTLLLGNNRESVIRNTCLYLTGILFSLAALTKEPFLLSSLPWFFYLALQPKQKWKQRVISVLWMSSGYVSVIVLFILVFWQQGNLDDWWNVIQYNRAYVDFSHGSIEANIFSSAGMQFYHYYISQSRVWFTLFCMGCLSIFHLSFIKKYNYLPCVILLQFLLEQAASHLSGFNIGHYYLQYTASYCLLGLCGMNALLHVLPKQKLTEWILCAIALTAFTQVDQSQLALYKIRMKTPYREANIGILSQTLREIKTEGDTLWTNLGAYSRYYSESGMISPCPALYAYQHQFIDSGSTTAQQKRDGLTACLQANPPTYMILSDYAIAQLEEVNLFALREWIRTNYTPNVDVTENGAMIYVYQNQ